MRMAINFLKYVFIVSLPIILICVTTSIIYAQNEPTNTTNETDINNKTEVANNEIETTSAEAETASTEAKTASTEAENASAEAETVSTEAETTNNENANSNNVASSPPENEPSVTETVSNNDEAVATDEKSEAEIASEKGALITRKCPKCNNVYGRNSSFCETDGTKLILDIKKPIIPTEEVAITEKAAGETLSLDPNDIFKRASKYIEMGDMFKDKRNDYQGAKRQYEAAVELMPNNPSLRYKLGGVYWKLGDHRKALEHLDACRALYPKSKPGKVKVDAYIAKLEKGLSEDEKEERKVTKAERRKIAMEAILKEYKEKWSSMATIPEGKFLMGSKNDEFNIEEMPQHEIYLSTFYMDKYEVTNGLYWEFLDYIKRTGDHSKCYIGEGPNKDHAPDKWLEDSYYEHAEWPVTRVDWYDAYAFAGWAGKRLPTEAEWEKAARGTDARRFPWGNVWDMGKCNAGTVGTLEVGEYEEGKSIFGVYDVCGSVQEWCNDWHHAMYYNNSPSRDPQGPLETTNIRVIRGSSLFANNVYQMRVTIRWYDEPHRRNRSVGFRCAKSVESKEKK